VSQPITEVTNKKQIIGAEENNGHGREYYNRIGLIQHLRGHTTDDELVELTKFIDESTANWSRFLALNTHKKQTEQTPVYSLQDGPGILTVLLERSDLEVGERAPQLQLILSRSDRGEIAITPRISGCMATSRMINTFDQINRELNAGRTVAFTSAESITTYIEQVSEHNGTVVGFRQELGDPYSALLQSGVPEPKVVFTAQRKDKQVEVRVLVEDENNTNNVLNVITLDNVGTEGRVSLEISEKTRFGSASAAAQELHTSETFKEVWQDVRETAATSDENIAAAEAVLREEQAPATKAQAEAVAEIALQVGPFGAIEILGTDTFVLHFFIRRLREAGDLSERDERALRAFELFVLNGEGLANLDKWSFRAAVLLEKDEEEKRLMRDDNNAYIFIYDDDNGANNFVIAAWQGSVANIKK
jgi:hypothetical protein